MRLLIAARNRAVGVEQDRIVAPEGKFDVVLECPDADVRPGLINAHDHLHRNHYGRLGGSPYRNAYQWAEDIQSSHRRHIAWRRRTPRREALLAGAWKNLFAGVTSVMHHDAWEEEFDRDFPVRVVRVPNADSLGMSPSLGRAGNGASDGANDGPFALHLAEGVDAGAAAEVRVLDEKGLLTCDLIAVHGVGMDADSIARFRRAGAALIWCPSSNLFLFERTAPAALLREGIDILLGSDSLLTAAGDLLDELRCARAQGSLCDARLEAAVGPVAARRFGLPAPSIEPGSVADLVLLSRPLLDACADDVVLVMIAGQPRVARRDVARRLGGLATHGAEMTVGSVTRLTYGAAPANHGRLLG